MTNTTLIEVDPRELLAHPANVRFDLGDLTELAEGIREAGMLEPIVVVPDGDGYRVVLGHRRTQAAVLAERESVPCLVRADLAATQADQLAAMLQENLHRRELSATEEVAAYAQLAAFPGYSADRIAKATGRPAAAVRHGLAVAKLPNEVAPAAIAGAITLEEAAEIETFADDPKAYRRLLGAAEKGHGFSYALADERRNRDKAQRIAETKAALTAAGVEIIAEPKSFPWNSVECPVTELVGESGESLNTEDHAACPGHAAIISRHSGAATYVCRNPKEWGHEVPKAYKHLSEEEEAALAAEEAQRQAFEDAFEVATEVRRAFIKERLAAKGKLPAGAMRLVVDVLLFHCAYEPEPADIASYLRLDADEPSVSLASIGEARLQYVLLAFVATVAEENLSAFDCRWRFDPSLAVARLPLWPWLWAWRSRADRPRPSTLEHRRSKRRWRVRRRSRGRRSLREDRENQTDYLQAISGRSKGSGYRLLHFETTSTPRQHGVRS